MGNGRSPHAVGTNFSGLLDVLADGKVIGRILEEGSRLFEQ